MSAITRLTALSPINIPTELVGTKESVVYMLLEHLKLAVNNDLHAHTLQGFVKLNRLGIEYITTGKISNLKKVKPVTIKQAKVISDPIEPLYDYPIELEDKINYVEECTIYQIKEYLTQCKRLQRKEKVSMYIDTLMSDLKSIL